MITKDLRTFAESTWQDYRESVTELSKSHGSGVSLVTSGQMLYNFDHICEDQFIDGDVPTSADALAVTTNSVELIEFKSGFRQKIRKDNLDPAKAICQHTHEICGSYWDLFFENQKRKLRELISSVRLKAIESYVTLEKCIFPLCRELHGARYLRLKLIVVIDEDGVDAMEDTLAELAGTQVSSNCYADVRRALSRLRNKIDAAGNSYYYDDIEVMSSHDFQNYSLRYYKG